MTLVQSVERTFEVLEAVARQPAGISELARRADLPTSTVARLLKTLEKIRVVERDDGGRYHLGPKAYALSSRGWPSNPMAAIDPDFLTDLALELGEIAGVSIRSGDTVLYVAQADSHHEVQIRDWTGEHVPLHAVSSGLVFLAYAPAKEVDRYLAQDLQRFTKHTVCDPEAIHQRLVEVERAGSAWTVGEFHDPVSSVAAPIFGPGRSVVGALHSHGPSFRFPAPGEAERVAGVVAQAAKQLSYVEDHAKKIVIG